MELMPVIVLILGVPVALAVWLIVRAIRAGSRLEELSKRLTDLEIEMIRLKREKELPKPVESTPAPQVTIIPPVPATPPQASRNAAGRNFTAANFCCACAT